MEKIFESFGNYTENINESANDFYNNLWIEELSKAFGEAEVDKNKKLKDLYGRDDLAQVGYKVSLMNIGAYVSAVDGSQWAIVEGVRINGRLHNAKVHILNGKGKFKKSFPLYFTLSDNMVDDHIQQVVDSMKLKFSTLPHTY